MAAEWRRAKVTLRGDLDRMHYAPCGRVSAQIRGLDARIVFARAGESVEIATDVPMIGILRAAAHLELARGAIFEVRCSGAEAAEAFSTLRTALTTGDFAGTMFEELPDSDRGD